MADGPQRPGSAEKSLGDIVGEVSEKATLLVREEIELAKAEVSTKVKKLGMGAGFIGAAVFLLLLFTIFFFHMLAWGFYVWFDLNIWVGYAIVCVLLLLVAGILAFLAVRAFKKGSPPVPEMAIDEAKKTRAAIEEARS
jgi:protein-S-isoprenylcysteine O-methyltransferase Ste14